MRPYRLPDVRIEIDRGTVLLDTSVLVARFLPAKQSKPDDDDRLKHLATVDYLATLPAAVVTDAVLAEAWGRLTTAGRGNTRAERRYQRQRMLDWVADPANGIVVVPDAPDSLAPISRVCRDYSVDVVDVLVANLAHKLSMENGDSPPFPVATFDPDYDRLGSIYTYEVVDPRSP